MTGTYNSKAASVSPVFIHAMARTGSTYLWSKFRQNPDFHCYYEPMNETIQTIDRRYYHILDKYKAEIFDNLHHPGLKKNHFQEYKNLLQKHGSGVRFYKKSFTFDEFCSNEENPVLKRYIDFLLSQKKGKRTLLQFNSTALRSRWFAETYPGSINIYLIRNPRDQWESYMDLASNNFGIFAGDLLAISKNKEDHRFRPLGERLPLFHYDNDILMKEIMFYTSVSRIYSNEEKYFLFYYLWLTAFFENLFSADYILSIDELSNNQEARNRFQAYLAGHGIRGVSFHDARIKHYTQFLIPPGVMEEIENAVFQIIIGVAGQRSPSDMRDAILRHGNTTEYINTIDMALSKSAGKIAALNAFNRTATGLLDEHQKAVISAIIDSAISITYQAEMQNRSLLTSYSYRLGQLMLAPFIFLNRLYTRLFSAQTGQSRN